MLPPERILFGTVGMLRSIACSLENMMSSTTIKRAGVLFAGKSRQKGKDFKWIIATRRAGYVGFSAMVAMLLLGSWKSIGLRFPACSTMQTMPI